jgi:general secretion pathway protein J
MSYEPLSANSRACRGFTLVEVLVALLIFGIITAVTYRALGEVLQTRERVSAENHRWRAIALALTRIEQDLAAFVNHPVHDARGVLQSSALIGNPVHGANEGILMFTRAGEPDANGMETAPIRVGYRLRGDVLEMITWPVLDAAASVPVQVLPLLSGVQKLDLAYLTFDGLQSPVWPRGSVAANARSWPDAVSLRITLADGQQITRLLALSPPGAK